MRSIQAQSSASSVEENLSELASQQSAAEFWLVHNVDRFIRPLITDLQSSVGPLPLQLWVRANRRSDLQMVRLFIMTLRIRHLVSDDSDLSVYSETARSRVYRYVAQQMPKMIFLATYCTEDIVQRMHSFVSQWEECELGINDEAVRIMHVLDFKHRGPFLFWLLNERSLATNTVRNARCAQAGMPPQAALLRECCGAAVYAWATAFEQWFGLA
jgi:hypothetical protein